MTRFKVELYCRACDRVGLTHITYDDLPIIHFPNQSLGEVRRVFVGCQVCRRFVICLLGMIHVNLGFADWSQRNGLTISMDRI